jgi:putative transposase
MDAYARLIVGWSIADHMRTELVVDALGMATLRRRPESDSTILHSDYAEPCVKPRDRVLACAGEVR